MSGGVAIEMNDDPVPPSASQSKSMISVEDIEKNGLKWAMSDTLRMGIRAVIVNTDDSRPSTEKGVHWLCVFPKFAYIFDPLGPGNHRVTKDGRDADPILARSLRLGKKNGVDSLRFYPHAVQSVNSVLCGFYSIYAATLINGALRTLKSAEDIDRLLEDHFIPGRDNSSLLEHVFGAGVIRSYQ